MKLQFEKVPRAPAQSFHSQWVVGRDYGCTWHFHPEVELTLVLKGVGHRLVGDNISPLAPGDLVLVGAGLPHVWHQDGTQDQSPTAVRAIVVQFTPDFLGAEFLRRPELERVGALFARAARGLHVTGRTRAAVAAELERLMGLRGLARLLALLGILGRLAASRELAPIASVGFRPALDRSDQDRMERVCRFIDARLGGPVMREDCAAQASLSPGAFSRFFRARTGKTFPAYVNELRISRACRLLGQTDEKITGVALACGFVNLPNFNLQFRRQTGLAPRAWRERLRRTAAA